jgi:hypothetical protein
VGSQAGADAGVFRILGTGIARLALPAFLADEGSFTAPEAVEAAYFAEGFFGVVDAAACVLANFRPGADDCASAGIDEPSAAGLSRVQPGLITAVDSPCLRCLGLRPRR